MGSFRDSYRWAVGVTAAALLGIAACGGSDAGTGAPPGGGEAATAAGSAAGAGQRDLTPPAVASTEPADGATGIAADAALQVTFTEAMDATRTEAAWSSSTAGLRPGEVAFSWSADGKVLTVTPTAPLAYATGADPAATPARAYDFTIGSGATDRAGNPLTPVTVHFTTLRHLVQALPGDPLQDGNVDGLSVNDRQMDFDVTTSSRGFLGFGLANVPPTVPASRILSATLRVNAEYPTVFTSQVVLLEHVLYGPALVAAAASTVPLASLGALAEEPPKASGWKYADVTAAVREDWTNRAARGARSQYRLSCSGCTVIFFAAEAATSSSGSASQLYPQLVLEYLAP